MSAQIKFGTSGWRAVIADDFTLANVRRAVAGIALFVVARNGPGSTVLVGRDPRYMGERFVEITGAILSAFGLQPLVIAEPAPTPAIARDVMRLGTALALNIT